MVVDKRQFKYHGNMVVGKHQFGLLSYTLIFDSDRTAVDNDSMAMFSLKISRGSWLLEKIY